MLSHPSGMTVSSRALGVLSDGCAHRNQRRSRWRKLTAGRQALLVVAYLRKGETYADLACGFEIGTSTVYRYIREALDLLATRAPTLRAAREHRIIDAIVAQEIPAVADTAYQGAGPTVAVPQRRRPHRPGHRPLPETVGVPEGREHRPRPPARTR